MAKVTLTVNIDGYHVSESASIVIEEPMVEAFKPMRLCDSPSLASVLGETLHEGAEAKRILKIREDAAKSIADAITKLILDNMKNKDTFNGYKI